jgi:hypothetical protein
MKKWKQNVSPIFLVPLVALMLAPHAWATTYTLSGATYDPAHGYGLYVNATGVTGSFTTASPLPPNLANAPIAGGTGGLGFVTSWSFYDGVFTYTEANSALWTDVDDNADSFAVSTDSGGNITDFFIVLTMPSSGAVIGQPTEFLFLGFDGPGTSGADKSICSALAPDGACSGYQITTDAASSAFPGTAMFSSSCKVNKNGRCRVKNRHP